MNRKYHFLLGGSLSSNTDGGGGVATLKIQEEGSTVQTAVDTINFVGANATAAAGATGIAVIYIPPLAYASHFNTNDGDNGSQAVTDNISRSSARISTPTTEGNPFNTGGWAATNQSSTLATTCTFTTAGQCTGFSPPAGGSAQFAIIMYSADGSTVLDSFTTNTVTQPLNTNTTYNSSSGNISITITNYEADSGSRYKAQPSILVNNDTIFTADSLEGGRFSVKITMTTDSTDGTGPYVYDLGDGGLGGTGDVFQDTNPTTPSIGGTVTIVETGGSVTTKYLSGLEYYTIASQFTASVNDIDQLNRNTVRTTASLQVTGTLYGLASLSKSPFGSGSADFSGWANGYNQDDVTYQITSWAVSSGSYRSMRTNGNISGLPRDTWGNGSTVNSSNASILVDTYGSTATDLSEDFNDESYRTDSTFGGGTWNSSTDLTNEEAMVYGGQLISPTAATLSSGGTNTNWTTFAPNAASQPNYGSLTAPYVYYRRVPDSTGLTRSSFTMVFDAGSTYVGSNALSDLENSYIEIYIRRISSDDGSANIGANALPLRLHTTNLYDFNLFDDGDTVGGSYIRLASSSGNTIEGTFGSYACVNGLYLEIRLANTAIALSGFDITFN